MKWLPRASFTIDESIQGNRDFVSKDETVTTFNIPQAIILPSSKSVLWRFCGYNSPVCADQIVRLIFSILYLSLNHIYFSLGCLGQSFWKLYSVWFLIDLLLPVQQRIVISRGMCCQHLIQTYTYIFITITEFITELMYTLLFNGIFICIMQMLEIAFLFNISLTHFKRNSHIYTFSFSLLLLLGYFKKHNN